MPGQSRWTLLLHILVALAVSSQCVSLPTSGRTLKAGVNPSGYFAMCLIAKNQHTDIREWLAYYKWIGASKIYVFDHHSEVPISNTIKDFIDEGLVDYFPFPETFDHYSGRPQLYVYDKCLHEFGPKHEWIAFIDADEYLVFKNGVEPNIDNFLKNYEPYGGLVVNWILFGSNGYKKKPDGPVLSSYWKCIPPDHCMNEKIKSIVHCKYGELAVNPHFFEYKEGYFAVNENFERVDGAQTDYVSTKKIALHHYFLKSEEEFRAKMKRGSAMGNFKSWRFFWATDLEARANCTDALPLVDNLKF